MNNNEKLAKLAVNKSLLKEYSNSSNERIVYMDDGTEFQIQLFNPYSYVIGVSFSFNDDNSYYNSNLLVLRPGERVWLDRYLDKESKLLFSTYEVGNSKAVKEAIKDNGKLTIKFYKEKEHKVFISSPIYVSTYEPYKNYNDYTVTCDTALSKSVDACCDSAINAVNFCNTTLGMSDISCATSYSASAATTASYSNDNNILSKRSSSNKTRSISIETGRIEEGSHSNQKFENVYKDFESWAFKTEYIKILPTSQKQINSNDLKKRYCYECGRKLNQKYKFCPYCGAEQ